MRLRGGLQALLDFAAVAAAVGFVASYVLEKDTHGQAILLFTNTITNGGDMGSHYYPALFLRQVLLPRGQVVGWCPGNYCGYPLFQFYFPLPFVLIAGLSLAMPLTVAFKVITMLGTIMLAPCAYLGLRLARVPFPGPALGALASLCFLFMEANSMWGGNIPSTLAGEFAFSLSLALAVLFLGTLRRTVESGRGRLGNAVLVAAIGLSHGYTLLWAGLTSLTELVTTREWWRRFGTLVVVHGLAILLMGFWLVPMLGYAPWTTAYSTVWIFKSWREMLPPILWPAAGVAVGSGLLVGVISLWRREPFPRGLAKIWAGTLIGVLFYFTASSFHVVEIRFVPFAQLGLCLAAAGGLGHLLAELPTPEIWPVVGGLVILPFVQSQVGFIPDWIRWNYSGYERKATWSILRDLGERLRGDFRDPRVVYEHARENEQLGTVRAFESLPLFSGRSTLEGLYMQGSPTAPFVFYIQSEVSKEQSCPFSQYGCSQLDLDHGIAHLRIMNVSHLIARTPTVKAAAAANPGLVREGAVGGYEIFRVRDNDGHYAVPLQVKPVLVLTASWKDLAYRWFKRAGPDDPVPVFATAAGAEEQTAFATVEHGELPRTWPRVALESPPTLSEQVETDRITVRGCRPGHPILIRISYHPRWKALTGERVWLAGPSFMLVFPRGERVELVFDGGGPVRVGHALTVLGALILLGGVLPVARRLAPFARPVLALPPVAALQALVARTERWTTQRRRMVLGAALVAVAVAFAAVAVAVRTSDADSLYRQGGALYDAGRFEEALSSFREAERLAPLSYSAMNSTYFESFALFRSERWAEAERAFQRLVDTFPEAAVAPEALYHVGLCRARRGNLAGAVAAWTQTTERYPTNGPWAKFARDRLAEAAAISAGR